MEDTRWGELVDDESSHCTSPYLLSFDDVEKLSKGFVSPALLNKNAKPDTTISTQMMPVSYFTVDSLTQHNIQLVLYNKKMHELHKQIHNSYMKTDIESIPPVPKLASNQQVTQNQDLQVTRKGAQQLLHKAVFDICIHEGFDNTSEPVLNILQDIAEEMLVKFCATLKVNSERALLHQSTGFVDAMERTLHDVGIQGVKELQNFYVDRVLRYNDRLKHQAEHLRTSCIAAAAQWSKKPSRPTPWEDSEWAEWSGNEGHDADENQSASFSRRRNSSTVELPPENSSNGEAVHQLHLEDNPTVLTPSLEPGLRMLYTLEQQEAAAGSHDGSGAITEEELSGLLTSPPAGSVAASASSQAASAGKNGNRKRRRN